MRRTPLTRRPAFTLLELLVVIGLLGVLTGLTVAGVQKGREFAGLTGCRNNLRQIGLALTHYHDTEGSFPPGYVRKQPVAENSFDSEPAFTPTPGVFLAIDRIRPRPGGNPPPGAPALPPGTYTSPGWGWAAHLLRNLEQENLSQRIDFSLPIEHAAHDGVRDVRLAVYTCPSDSSTGPFDVLAESNDAVLTRVSTNSYAACWGEWDAVSENPGSGMFYCNSSIRTRQITDGMSSTIAVGERPAMFARAPWAGAVSMGSIRTTVGAPVYQSLIEEAPVMALARNSGRRGVNDPYLEPYDFFSSHRSVLPFLFADGSVHTLTPQVDPQVLRKLCTIAGEEVIDASSY